MGQMKLDTIYYDQKNIKAIGFIALKKDSSESDIRINKWINYYKNGSIESIGNYSMSSYIDCNYVGWSRNYYAYKIGSWTYFYQNGNKMAEGIYSVKLETINNSCKKGAIIKRSRINNKWKYWDVDSNPIMVTNDLKKEIEFSDFFDYKAK